MAADGNPASSGEDVPKAGLLTDLPHPQCSACEQLTRIEAVLSPRMSLDSDEKQGGLKGIMGEKGY